MEKHNEILVVTDPSTKELYKVDARCIQAIINLYCKSEPDPFSDRGFIVWNLLRMGV